MKILFNTLLVLSGLFIALTSALYWGFGDGGILALLLGGGMISAGTGIEL